MGGKTNCWEAKHCGREPGGVHEGDLGACPAATETRTNGMNGGTNGGRVCYALAGTLCGGEVQGTFAGKLHNCLKCQFYKDVLGEERGNCVIAREVLDRIAQ